MTAEQMLAAAAADSFGRLRWTVLRRLGVCPLSPRARLLTRRGVLRLACQMVLDGRGRAAEEAEGVPAEGENPHFDDARFRALREAER